jgi:hypothetical protein
VLDTPASERDRAGREIERFIPRVRAHKNSTTIVAKPGEGVAKPCETCTVKASRRLVEKKQARGMQQCTRYRKPLPHAARIRADEARCTRSETARAQGTRHTGRNVAEAIEPREERKILLSG